MTYLNFDFESYNRKSFNEERGKKKPSLRVNFDNTNSPRKNRAMIKTMQAGQK